jgi:hypothetical protein
METNCEVGAKCETKEENVGRGEPSLIPGRGVLVEENLLDGVHYCSRQGRTRKQMKSSSEFQASKFKVKKWSCPEMSPRVYLLREEVG